MDKRTSAWAARAVRRALWLGGAHRMALYRPERDENGAATGAAQRLGCVYGVRTEEALRAQAHIALPGVVTRRGERVYLCAMCGCAGEAAVGDVIEDGGARYEVTDIREQAGVAVRLIAREGGGDAAGTN